MKTSKGASAIGAPGGKKRLRKCVLFLTIPIIFKPINPASAVQKVTIRWLVTVKLYGIIPSKLQTSIIIKVVKIKGKCFINLGPAFSFTTPKIME